MKKTGLLLFVLGMSIVAFNLLNKGTFMKVCPNEACQNPVFAQLNFTHNEEAKTVEVKSPTATVQLQKCAYKNARNWQCTNPMSNMAVTMKNGQLNDNEPRTQQVGGVVYRVNKWLGD